MEQDVRWKQRFSNYKSALAKLSDAVKYINATTDEHNAVLNEIVKEGLIQRFEYTHELAWNVMKDYALYQGNNTIGGSRDATREALSLKLMDNGDIWMDMIRSRNETSHTYNSETAEIVVSKIVNDFYPALLDFCVGMEKKCNTV
ncbi:nucleotidyltransferase [Spirochaetia bacterium]|nr:nucleotidyltransferase [Spirochaetia bacterium]